MTELAGPPPGSRGSRELLWISAVFALVLGALLVVGATGVQVLFTLRTYAAGEGQFARAHKAALFELVRYSDTRDPVHVDRFRKAIDVLLADRRARIALEAPEPDLPAAERDLIEGRHEAEDVPAMTRLFPYLDAVTEAHRAFERWAATDADIDRMIAIGDELHAAFGGAGADPERMRAVLAELDAIDARLVALEDAFGRDIAITARRVKRIVVATSAAVAAALLCLAVLSTARLLDRLRRSELRFRSLVEYGQDVVLQISLDGTIRYASPAVQRRLGWTPEELVGTQFMRICHRDDWPALRRAQAEALASPGQAMTSEARVRHADGSWRLFAAVGGALPEEAGGPGTVISARDVTDERMLAEQLAQSQRLESIGRLAGGIAHDFNNLLTAILGSATLARQQLPTDSPAREELEEIANAGERAARLTQQLLAFARRQVVEPRVFDAHGVIRAMESMLRRLLGAHVELAVELGPEPAPIHADPGQIEQVLVNLAVNARDAMPDGGRLQISTSVAGDRVRIDVTDTGVAMSDEVKEHAFEPFFTTKEEGKGTGLGLATCYGIVTQSGGTIGVESSRGRGTTFRIELPLAHGLVSDPRLGASEQDPRGHELVLVAEDEPGVRRILVSTLRDRGYRVLEAEDGVAALRIAEQAAEPIALLVTDVVMPRLGGRQLVEKLRWARPDLRVVFVSGFTEDPVVLDSVESEHATFLQKPFTPTALARKVREALDRKPSGPAA
jgi:PAS domain S-box-containing protein